MAVWFHHYMTKPNWYKLMMKYFPGSDSGLSCSCLRDPQPSTIQDFNYETLQFQEERLNQVPGLYILHYF